MVSSTVSVVRRIQLLPLVVVALTGLLLAGCSSQDTELSAPREAHTRSAPVTKLLVVVEENHSLSQMRAGMPATARLAQRYGYATDYHAMRHPSLPNYLAIAGGDMYGVGDDDPPSQHPVSAQSVFGQALAAGRTAGVYADAMPSDCATANQGRYAVRHNPWTYFTAERDACRQHDRPVSALAGDVRAGRLPNAGMVVPDLCHDAHDCSLHDADAWFAELMGTVTNGPDWRSGRLAIVLTADEDDHDNQGNLVLTTVSHPSQHHRVVTTPLTHYSLTRLYDEVLGVAPLRHAAEAPSMAKAFHLPLARDAAS